LSRNDTGRAVMIDGNGKKCLLAMSIALVFGKMHEDHDYGW